MEWQIDLGEVHETAEVTLNGKALGAAWKSPRRLDCGAALRAGRNALRVEVANLWIHHMLAQPPPAEWKAVDETFGVRWGRYGEVKPEKVPPSGLLGPVRPRSPETSARADLTAENAIVMAGSAASRAARTLPR